MKKVIDVKNKDGVILRKKVVTENKKPSLTDQSYKESTDAKQIVKTFLKTGVLTNINHIEGKYADVSEVQDLYENMTKIKQVQKYFMDLPAEIRKKFDNDPQKMLEFVVDDNKEQEQIDLGLKKKPDVEKDTGKDSDVKDPGANKTDPKNN